MLRELRIENLLLIEEAELRLDGGLNVITGETGAGKTMLAQALDLVLGGKPRDGLVRPGAEEGWVEATFDLPSHLTDTDDLELAQVLDRIPGGAEELTLGRRVAAGGRTSAYIGGRSASAADLAQLGTHLVAFFGQHQQRRLTIASAQTEILDAAGGQAATAALGAYLEAHATVIALNREIESLRASDGNRERDLDLLQFELSEIEATDPSPGEDEALETERRRLRHAERLREGAFEALGLLTGEDSDAPSAVALADRAAGSVSSERGTDEALDRIGESLKAAAIELEDAAGELRRYLDGLDADPGRLTVVEERLEALSRLKRKHGGTIEAVLAHGERSRAEIARLEQGESRLDEIEAELERAEERRRVAAADLTAAREGARVALESAIAGELAELGMEGASFEVELHPHPDGFGPRGAERIELLLATNPGLPAAPLRDAASGGELSRVMLALSVASGSLGSKAVVFDEIDAGVGGRTANAVGERLKRLGRSGQVIAITHLPQVAAQAEVHLRVTKDSSLDPARACVERLRGDGVIEEITRMLGAESGDKTAASHARELVAASDSG